MIQMIVLKNMFFSYKYNVVAPANNSPTKSDVNRIFIIPNASPLSTSDEMGLNSFNNTGNDGNKESDFDNQQPTCSYSLVHVENDSNDRIEKDIGIKDKTSISSIRENMISDLLSNIDNEAIYIKKLTHFVDLEMTHRSGKDTDTLKYDYEQLGVDTLPHFIGCSKRKSDMRSTKLQKLFNCREENDTYEIYFEQFVDMEENFLENGC